MTTTGAVLGLEGVVAAPRRVRARDEGRLASGEPGCLETVGDGLPVDPLRVGRVEAAGIRHDVDGERIRRQAPLEVLDPPRGDDGKIGHRLGAGRVVIEDDERRATCPGDVLGGDGGPVRQAPDQFVPRDAHGRHLLCAQTSDELSRH